PGQHVPGRHPVADEEGICHGHVDGDAARRMTRKTDDAWAAGQIEYLPVVHLYHFGEVRGPGATLAYGVREEPDHRTELDPSPRGLVLDLTAGPRGVRSVHINRHTALAPEPLGETDVVAIAVREYHAANIGQRPTHARQLRRQVAPMTRQASIDDGHALIGVD